MKFRKNPIHPFEDDTMLCKFSYKFDHSLFVFGCSTKKRPNTLVFGRMFDHHMLDMMELQMLNFVPSAEFNVSFCYNPNKYKLDTKLQANGVTLGSKPCVLLQGPLFESNETLQRMGNLMVDWFQGVKVETIRLQGLELVIALTAVSEEKVLLRVYK
jgi:ribosome production factor 2